MQKYKLAEKNKKSKTKKTKPETTNYRQITNSHFKTTDRGQWIIYNDLSQKVHYATQCISAKSVIRTLQRDSPL